MLLYVLAAGATLAGAAGAAQAKVVFTPNSTTFKAGFGRPNTMQIDMNNDGTVDFTLSFQSSYTVVSCSSSARQGDGRRPPDICPEHWAFLAVQGNQPSDGALSAQNGLPAALGNTAKIGSSANFAAKGLLGGEYSYFGRPSGNFTDTINRYAGVRFLINGEIHYGWIGFRSVSFATAQFVGWAYETEPNKPILTGFAAVLPSAELRSPEVRPAEPTSLELLAAGHVAVADWRRRNEAMVMPVASPS